MMTKNSIDQKFALTTSNDVNNFDNLSNNKKISFNVAYFERLRDIFVQTGG